MPSSPVRWGILTLTIAIATLAVALKLQQPLSDPFGGLFSSSSSSSPSRSPQSQPRESVHCYEGIRTQDQHRPSARCFSVSTDGRFHQVVDSPEELSAAGVEVVPESGYVIPGLWDGHGHLLQYGEFLHSVDLFGSQSLDDIRVRVKAYLAANPGAGTKEHWVRGVGWDQTAFGRMPTADDLEQDPELAGLYIMLDRIDVHCSWVSRQVLALLPPDLDDVPGGEIVRDPGMGVFCDNAIDLVADLWPRPSEDIKAAQVASAMASLNSVGIVGMHDAGITPANIDLYERLADGDDWTVRVYGMLECNKRNSFCPGDARKILRDDAKFTLRSVKLFADGALGSWGSAMLEPYSDHPWTSGSLLINATALTAVSQAWAALGYQVNIHAIGDLANRNAIDALEAALTQQCLSTEQGLAACQSAHRFRIEHAQIIHPSDQERILNLGILPSIQPTHATSDFKYAESRLGHDRLHASAYRMRSLLPARPVLGSDFPVEPPDPFQGIFAAVARRNPHSGKGPLGRDDDGFLMDEALSLDDALRGFTQGPAYGAFLEGKAGVIREGAFADWVVLDNPIERTEIETFMNLKVRETWVGGEQVYRRP